MKLSAFSPESVGNGFLAVQEQMSVGDFLAALLVSLAAAAAASLLYRFFYERRGTGSQIHRAFPLLALAVTTLFIGVQLSLPLSLGLLGSLSIIRFRTPIKEPEEVGLRFPPRTRSRRPRRSRGSSRNICPATCWRARRRATACRRTSTSSEGFATRMRSRRRSSTPLRSSR